MRSTQREVLGEAADVRDDERRPGVRGDERLERGDEAVEAREAAAEVRPVGLSISSSRRSLAPSTGSKNATGSAVWMSTGRPSSPAAANTGARRSSSGSTMRPSLVGDAEAEVLPDLEAARAGVARAPQARDQHLGVEAGPADGAQVDVAERDETARVRAVVAVEVALELVVPEAVEVDDRLDAGLVERREGSPTSAIAHGRSAPRTRSAGSSPSQSSHSRASGRGGCARRSPARAAAARPSSAARAASAAASLRAARVIALMQAAR